MKYKTSDVAQLESNNEESSPWLLRSDLVLTMYGSSVRVNLKAQSAEIKAVIRRAIDIADLYIIFGAPAEKLLNEDTVLKIRTPFTASGLHYLVHLALIDAADELGYNKDRDIVERLEEGSLEHYVKPLRGHVFYFISSCTLCSLMYFPGCSSYKCNSKSNS